MSDKTKGFIFAIIALFSWGIHGPAGRWLSVNGVDPFFVFATRLWIGTAVFFVYLVVRRALDLTILKKHWKHITLVALVGICLNSAFYHLSLVYLHGTLVMILENLSPVFVFILSFLILKIKPTKVQIISLIISLTGLYVIMMGKGSFPELGDTYGLGIVLGVLTGLTFGIYVFFSATLMTPYKSDPLKIIQMLFSIFLISSILMTPIIFLHTGEKPNTNLEWLWLLEMGLFQSGVAYLFWNYALAYLPVNTSSVLFALAVFFTTVNEVLFLHLKVNHSLVLGGVLIMLASYLLSKEKGSAKAKRQET
ncbi:MAG: EamA family transporter [Candidatus Cloacimonetes bacterium]|nr:EamA family transporter [Candidatus Cloacimonadota bacterium]